MCEIPDYRTNGISDLVPIRDGKVVLSCPLGGASMMRSKLTSRIFAGFAVASSVSGCATPVSYSSAPLTRYDKDTEYSYEATPSGFTLAIYYSRYQFIPESDAVSSACRSALTAIAHELAERQGRKIKQINEQRIRVSLGRNGVGGITSCSASAPAEWA